MSSDTYILITVENNIKVVILYDSYKYILSESVTLIIGFLFVY